MDKKNYRKNITNKIKIKTGNAPDIKIKDYPINNEIITFVYSNSVSSSSDINDFILRRLDEEINLTTKNLYEYFKNYIPNNSLVEINTIKDAIYYILNGFTLIIFNSEKMLAFENKAKINSDIQKSENETSLKGPSDSFTENYETNTGLIRKRLKTDKLWIKENTIGTLSNTKVSLFYLKDICDENLVNNINKKIKNINMEYVGNSNYIIDAISNTNRSIFPTHLVTERPDYACQMLLEGRIIIMVENSNKVIILPCLFMDFMKNPDDYYEKTSNVFLSRIIRIFAFILTIITPALYIALMTHNVEAIPSGLLINLSIQRDGVPFSTLFEVLVMLTMFQILRESDIRFPGKGGSSISIVGGLVLGQAAVDAGIVSPITIIVVGISSVASLAFSSIELINSYRWWQLILIILGALFGFVGVMFGIVILLALLVSQKSCSKPYFSPLEPFNKKKQKDNILISKNSKFHPLNIYDKEDKDEKNI